MCEGRSRQIDCPLGFRIQVQMAEWGRSSDAFCQADERESPVGRPHRRPPCANSVLAAVGRLCERRHSCLLRPTRDSLSLGQCQLDGPDAPFLELTYHCVFA